MKTNLENLSERELAAEQLKELRAIRAKLPDSRKPTLASLGFITNNELMIMLGIGRAKAAQLRDSGELRYSRHGNLIFYKIEDVIDFLNRGFERI